MNKRSQYKEVDDYFSRTRGQQPIGEEDGKVVLNSDINKDAHLRLGFLKLDKNSEYLANPDRSLTTTVLNGIFAPKPYQIPKKENKKRHYERLRQDNATKNYEDQEEYMPNEGNYNYYENAYEQSPPGRQSQPRNSPGNEHRYGSNQPYLAETTDFADHQTTPQPDSRQAESSGGKRGVKRSSGTASQFNSTSGIATTYNSTLRDF